MRTFPGPLGKCVPCPPLPRPCRRVGQWLHVASLRLSPFTECGSFFRDDTHKVDVINFAQSKATKCLQDESLLDKESASLLWNLIVLLCRQNGVRVLLPLNGLEPQGPPAPLSWVGFPCRPECGGRVLSDGSRGGRRCISAMTQGRGRQAGCSEDEGRFRPPCQPVRPTQLLAVSGAAVCPRGGLAAHLRRLVGVLNLSRACRKFCL